MIVTCPTCSTHYRHPAPGPGDAAWGRCMNCAARFRLVGRRMYRLVGSVAQSAAPRRAALEPEGVRSDVGHVEPVLVAPLPPAPTLAPPKPSAPAAVPAHPLPACAPARKPRPRSLGALLLPVLLGTSGATSGYALAVVLGHPAEALAWSAGGGALAALVGWSASRRSRSNRGAVARADAR